MLKKLLNSLQISLRNKNFSLKLKFQGLLPTLRRVILKNVLKFLKIFKILFTNSSYRFLNKIV